LITSVSGLVYAQTAYVEILEDLYNADVVSEEAETLFLEAATMDTEVLQPMYSLYSAAAEAILQARLDFAATFILISCCVLIGFLVIMSIAAFPLMNNAIAEHEALYRFVLFLPPSVIEESEPIKHFLATGKITNTDDLKSIDQEIEHTQDRTNNVIQAAADAIIVFDSKTLNIVVFNTAAERMFGYDAEDVMDQRVDLIIGNAAQVITRRLFSKSKLQIGSDDEDDELEEDLVNNDEGEAIAKNTIEVQAKKADGTAIPTTITMSRAGNAVALFIRDIRDIKEYQHLIENNATLLQQMLPEAIVTQMKDIITRDEPIAIAQNHEMVSILFADMVHFTNWSAELEPKQLVKILNAIVSKWDGLAGKFRVEKIKTIGDCFMAVCGCPEPNSLHADCVVGFAEAMIIALAQFNIRTGNDLHIRVGVHSGPVVAGVIGLNKILYDIWGREVSTASRMESSGVADSIHVF
jgi:class 3 adenylate cyclase